MAPYLLIDTSYTIFFRYYATKRWYNFSHPEDKFEEDYEWFNNEIFKNMFEKQFYDSFTKIIKKYNVPEKNIVFIRDCPRNEIWINKFSNIYKANRDELYGSDNKIVFKGGPFFKYTYNTIIPDIVSKKGSKVIKHDNMEADDIIALTKNYLRNKYPDEKIIIVASDCDLLQLLDDNTDIINLKNQLLNKKSTGNPKMDLEIKILCGDKSDNISSCFNKCGIKTATKLFNDKNLLAEKFKKNPDSLDKYALNKILIDFSNIPKELVNSCSVLIKEFNL